MSNSSRTQASSSDRSRKYCESLKLPENAEKLQRRRMIILAESKKRLKAKDPDAWYRRQAEYQRRTLENKATNCKKEQKEEGYGENDVARKSAVRKVAQNLPEDRRKAAEIVEILSRRFPPPDILLVSEIYDNHYFKCRICFRSYTKETRIKDIDQTIREQFKQLTNMELKSSKEFSKTICGKCENEMKRILRFRDTIKARQKGLYQYQKNPEKFEKKKSTISSLQPVVVVKREKFDSYEDNWNSQFNAVSETLQPSTSSAIKTEAVFIEDKSENVEEGDVEFKNEEDEKPAVIFAPHQQQQQILPQSSPQVASFKTIRNIQSKLEKKLIKQILSKKKHPDQLAWPKHQCDLCGYEYTLPSNVLMRHHINTKHRIKILQKDKSYKCDLCGKVLKSKYNLKKHMQSEMMKKSQPNYGKQVCDICGESGFKSLWHHKKSRHQKKPGNFYCDFCMKPYSNKFNVLDHIQRVHLNLEKKFLCHLCSKSYATASSLNSHLSMHRQNGSSNVKCPLCDYIGTKRRLAQHHRIRHELRRFSCVFKFGCDVNFRERSTMLRHIMRVHKVTDKNELDEYQRELKLVKPIYISAEEMEAYPRRNYGIKKRV